MTPPKTPGPSSAQCVLPFLAALVLGACAGRTSERPPPGPDPSRGRTSGGGSPADSLRSAASALYDSLPPDEVHLVRKAYAMARASADPTSIAAVRADALAEEAETFAVLGDDVEAVNLWMEAIVLLEPSLGDSTSSSGRPPAKPRSR